MAEASRHRGRAPAFRAVRALAAVAAGMLALTATNALGTSPPGAKPAASMPLDVDLLRVGDRVPPYPAGLESHGGTCVLDPTSGDICGRSIGVLGLAGTDGPAVIYAGLAMGMAADNAPIWQVTDILAVPEITEDHYLATGDCVVEGDRRHIVAVARYDEEVHWLEDIAWSVGLDPDTGLFSPVDAYAVLCENPLP